MCDSWIFAGRHRCRDCGETCELMIQPPYDFSWPDPVVGGLHVPTLQVHGPGCTGQIWDSCDRMRKDGK